LGDDLTVRLRLGSALMGLMLLLATNGATTRAQSTGDPIAGIVADRGGSTVWLADGGSFDVTDQTRVTLVATGTPADLTPGLYVAITARPDADGVLLASMVNTFLPEQRGTGEGQRPMDEGNVMTNANIDEALVDAVDGGDLTVSFLGETAIVRITPETRIDVRSAGSLTDVGPGASITAQLVDGVARTIAIR
jgi:hypothetical protein